MQLWRYIKEAMLKNPRQKVCEQQAEMNYEELIMFTEMFAHKLTQETCCAILCGSEMATSMALLSCFAAGVTAVPLSVRYGELHRNKILDMISPSAIITDMDGQLQVIHMTKSNYIQPQEHPALIMCTSGTTGKPKGVMLSEQNILTNVKDICSYLAINQADTILIARPMYHCAVLTGEFITSLLKGVKIQFYSEEFQPRKLFQLISEKEITVFCGTPTMLSMMARFKRNNTKYTIKTICISGECMSKETGKLIANSFPNADIYHVYGLTEACPRVSYLPPDLFEKHPDSVGVALHSVSLKIMKSDGRIADVGEEGILWVRGGNVMLGYYNDEEQTTNVLRNGWLCTGDIAVIDANGLLKIIGRSDDLIIRAGMNIYPQEIEKVLKIDPRVKEVLVYGINNPYGGVMIGMKISGDFSTIDEVKQLCIRVLPSFQIPSHIELLEELPKSGSGKIVRNSEKKKYEREKKILLSFDEYSTLLTIVGHVITSYVQVNYYYDTNDFKLDKRGITCRIRKKHGKYIATIKEHNPDFCEYNLEKSKVVIDEQDDSLFDGMGIEMQGSLITERTIMYSVGGCEVVLDKNTYLGMTDYELEIEYAEENESYAEHIIQNFGQILFSNNMIQEISEFCNRSKSTKSKSARFFERKSFISDNRCPE